MVEPVSTLGGARRRVRVVEQEDDVAKLIYSAIASLDGYVEDPEGGFEWAAPDEEVHTFVNDLERSIGTYLYGRRMYETMVFWETASTRQDDEPPAFGDYAEIWQAADKVVYSRTLSTVTSARTRLEREFDPHRSDSSRRPHGLTSPSAAPSWAARRSLRGSSTSCSCCSDRSWWAAARPRCPLTSTWDSSCWTSGGSPAASCSSGTPSPAEPPNPASRRRNPSDQLRVARVGATCRRVVR